jgi:hypothetical protein
VFSAILDGGALLKTEEGKEGKEGKESTVALVYFPSAKGEVTLPGTITAIGANVFSNNQEPRSKLLGMFHQQISAS